MSGYETDLYFFQNFQWKTMLIYAICKIYKHEIVFVLICSSGRTRRTISGLQLLQNTRIIKKTVVFLSKYWRNMDLSFIHLPVIGSKVKTRLPSPKFWVYISQVLSVKLRFCENTTKVCKIITLNLMFAKMEIWQNFEGLLRLSEL